MPEWKAGDVAACRVCIGYHVIVTFDCGHTAEARADFAEPGRGCPDCRPRIWADKQRAAQKRGAAASAVYAGNEAEAQSLLDQIAVPDLPAPLVVEWRRVALHMLRYALAGEAVDGVYGQVTTALDGVRGLSSEMVPSVAALGAAADSGQLIEVAEKAHWPAGWLHWHGQDAAPAPSDDPDVACLASMLETACRGALNTELRSGLTAKHITGWLTNLVTHWSRAHPGWRAYKELGLPVAPDKAVRFGRLDLVVLRRPADLVIELDSRHNAGSAEKLAYARNAGATAVWIRWLAGPIEAPPGVQVIDLRAPTAEILTRSNPAGASPGDHRDDERSNRQQSSPTREPWHARPSPCRTPIAKLFVPLDSR
jgi:hypothetical protein